MNSKNVYAIKCLHRKAFKTPEVTSHLLKSINDVGWDMTVLPRHSRKSPYCIGLHRGGKLRANKALALAYYSTLYNIQASRHNCITSKQH